MGKSQKLLQEIPPKKFFEALLEGNEENEGQVDILRMAVMAKLENVRCYLVGEIEVEIYCVHSGIRLDLDYSQA